MKSSTTALVIAGALIILIGVFLVGSTKPTQKEVTVLPSSSATAPDLGVDTPKAYTRSEVAAHNNRDDCYTIVGTNVYNVTPWVTKHPGGEQAILGLCGSDGTAAFTKQHGSTPKAQSTLAAFFIGIVTN